MQTVRTNVKINASTQYTNFNHVAMCRFNGLTLGAGPGGLFKACCGPDDNGVAIDAYFVPVTTDFGEINNKRVHFLNFSGEATGNLYCEITGDDRTTIGPYEIVANLTKSQQRIRVKTGKGMAFCYGKIKIGNVDGSYFAVDKIGVVASVTKRGIK